MNVTTPVINPKIYPVKNKYILNVLKDCGNNKCH